MKVVSYRTEKNYIKNHLQQNFNLISEPLGICKILAKSVQNIRVMRVQRAIAHTNL